MQVLPEVVQINLPRRMGAPVLLRMSCRIGPAAISILYTHSALVYFTLLLARHP